MTGSDKNASHYVLYIVTPHSAITVVYYCTIIVQLLYPTEKGITQVAILWLMALFCLRPTQFALSSLLGQSD